MRFQRIDSTRFIRIAGTTVMSVLLFGCAAPQADKPSLAKGTPLGHPDLQGIYTTDEEWGLPFERPKQFGDRAFLTAEEFAAKAEERRKSFEDKKDDRPPEPSRSTYLPDGETPLDWFEALAKNPSHRTSFVIDPPDGRVPPLTEFGKQHREDLPSGFNFVKNHYAFRGPEDFNLWERCISRGLPQAWIPSAYDNGFRIVQTPDSVVVAYERWHETRVIPVDGRPHLGAANRNYLGDSRGHWEGDTLVVDVSNFRDQNAGSFAVADDHLHLTERLRLTDPDTLRIEIRIDDPTIWTKPWTVAVTAKRNSKYRIFEMACHEGNKAIENILTNARDNEKQAAGKH